MRNLFLIGTIFVIFAGCEKGPLHLQMERRFYPTMFSGFSDRVVTESNLVADKTSLYFGTRAGTVYALDGKTGKEKWNMELEGSIDSQLHSDDQYLYVGTSAGHFYSLATKDGGKRWEQKVSGEVVGEPAFVGKNLVLFGANDGIVYAVDAKSGEIRWRYRSDIPDRIGIHGFARPLVADQKIYAALGDGSVALLRANDGTEISRQSLGGRARFPEVIAPLLASDGNVIAAQFFGTLHALGSDGSSRWSVPSGGTGAAPAISGKTIYTGGAENQLMALDSESGERKWVREVGPTANWSGILFHHDYVIATTHEGKIFVLKAADGSLVWTYDVAGAIGAPPVIVAETIWVLTNRAQLLGLQLRH